MEDEEILNTVHSMFGKGAKIVDCQKTSSVQEEEILLINGVQVKLDAMPNDEAKAIKTALLDGQTPSIDLLNRLLYQAGLERQPVELETTMSVKSSLLTKEAISVSRKGMILDQQTSETKEDYLYLSKQKELINPIRSKNVPEINQDSNLRNALRLTDSNCTITTNSTLGGAEGEFSNYSTLSSVTADSSSSSLTCGRSAYNSEFQTDVNSISYDSGHEENKSSYSLASSLKDRNTQISNTPIITMPKTPEVDTEEIQYGLPQKYTIFRADCIDENRVLVYRNGCLVSGSLDTMIMHLVPRADDYFPNEDFQYTFLLCARFHIKPHDLLAKVIRIWTAQTLNQDNNLHEYIENILKLVNNWMKLFPNDFQHESIIEEVRSLSKKCEQIVGNKSKTISSTLKELMQYLENIISNRNFSQQESPKQTSLEHSRSSNSIFYRNSFNKGLQHLENMIHTKSFKKSLDTMANPIQLSQQLTAIELEFLCRIQLEELIGLFANDFQNLDTYIGWSKKLSYLVATEIVKCQKKKQRVHMVEYWIETARECFNIGNFNSLMSILAGLNLTAVSRLKISWSKVKSAKFSVLEHQMDPSLNFNSYRSTMKAAVWRSESATNERERIIIPFFTLFFKDLNVLNETCSKLLSNNHINYEKCLLFGQLLKDINKWKQLTCPYEKKSPVIEYLHASSGLNDETLLIASFECEAPSNAEEKEQLKNLKEDLKRSASN